DWSSDVCSSDLKIFLAMRNSCLFMLVFLSIQIPLAKADAVSNWNKRAGDIVVNANIGPLPAERALAIVQASVYEAVNAITQRYPVNDLNLPATAGASIDAAIAAANRIALTELIPNQEMAIAQAYRDAIKVINDGSAKQAGIAVGEKAAHAVLALRADDG